MELEPLAVTARNGRDHLDRVVDQRFALLANRHRKAPPPLSRARLLRALRLHLEETEASPMAGITPEAVAFHANRLKLCLTLGESVVVSVENPHPNPDYGLDVIDAEYVNEARNLAHFGNEGWAAVTFRAEPGCHILLDVSLNAKPGTFFHCGFGTEDVHPYVGWDTKAHNNDLAVGDDLHLIVPTVVPANVDGHAAMIFWPNPTVPFDLFECKVMSF